MSDAGRKESRSAPWSGKLHRSDRRPKNLLFFVLSGVLIAASMCLFLLSHVLTVVNVTVDADPEHIFADGKSSCTIVVRTQNKLGFDVPFSSHRFRCFFEEGAELAVLAYADDSTSATLSAGDKPGAIMLRIVTTASPYPLLLRVELRALMARCEIVHGVPRIDSMFDHPQTPLPVRLTRRTRRA